MNKITEFIKLFEEYNTHTNLMSKNDIQKLKEKHIPDCLAIEKFFEKYKEICLTKELNSCRLGVSLQKTTKL